MKVTLIEFTGKGYENPARRAAELLVFTKSTRLNMTPGLMEEISKKSDEGIEKELDYMANTIPSSWEFLDFIFLIEGVSRGFTHQFVRTRPNSYAQQTMRVLDVSEGRGWDYLTGPTILAEDVLQDQYDETMTLIAKTYRELIEKGAAIEDARGILPTNILTNITVKMNFRTMVETMHKRASPRTQDEYRRVNEEIKRLVLEAYPWASLFLDRTIDAAIADLQSMIDNLMEFPADRIKATKLLDQLRSKV